MVSKLLSLSVCLWAPMMSRGRCWQKFGEHAQQKPLCFFFAWEGRSGSSLRKHIMRLQGDVERIYDLSQVAPPCSTPFRIAVFSTKCSLEGGGLSLWGKVYKNWRYVQIRCTCDCSFTANHTNKRYCKRTNMSFSLKGTIRKQGKSEEYKTGGDLTIGLSHLSTGHCVMDVMGFVN